MADVNAEDTTAIATVEPKTTAPPVPEQLPSWGRMVLIKKARPVEDDEDDEDTLYGGMYEPGTAGYRAMKARQEKAARGRAKKDRPRVAIVTEAYGSRVNVWVFPRREAPQGEFFENVPYGQADILAPNASGGAVYWEYPPRV